jgi:hypothetical protein
MAATSVWSAAVSLSIVPSNSKFSRWDMIAMPTPGEKWGQAAFFKA